MKLTKRTLLPILMLAATATGVQAQRQTDVLDRGLVAVKTSGGVLCSWRILGSEYYDVTYNVYRDGTKLNSTPLSVSNYVDAGGTTSSTYTVEALVRGVSQGQSSSVTTWANNYKEITMDHGDLTSTYRPNDACVADVDGDGELEILLKFDNRSDANNGYLPEGHNGEYAIIEVYKLDGTKLWWIDLGPNMADFQNNENNIVAYDWDGDGKAEAVMRAADGTVIHHPDGTTTVIGDSTKNYRASGGYSSGEWFVYQGDEFLLYLNGETGKVYQNIEYPLKRFESGETSLSTAWGDGYGHRSTKHFFGAPYLDGHKPSIFLARGIYTRHKMIALDVDPSTHTLTERWRWNCSDSSSDWYGQGYHNFGIADVDWDGRDEIVFGSMVIDDNGKGLSTTGLGHGDAQHCGDFDPYTHGQEIFACNESNPSNNLRDATTSKIYYRLAGGNDDGRCIMGNFLNDVPGAVGTSTRDANLIGATVRGAVSGTTKSDVSIAQNFRIYWDGDLCEESFNYINGKDTEGAIYKARTGYLATMTGGLTNNDTKGTPCFMGDILGDWREELIMRTEDNNIRIFTTNYETTWRNYSLWYDHQYRNGMVWEMCGYNQPPHVSYYLGEMEGITVAPPPLTMTGRTEISNGGTIGSSTDDTHIIMCENNDMTVTVASGASPYIYTDNAPTWVQGHDDNDNITTTTYTHTLAGAAFTGAMRLVKQGDGILVLPNVTQTYTGSTDVWAGTLSFDGTMQNSRVWLNRHSNLVSNGGVFAQTIQADYNASIKPGTDTAAGTVETSDSLILNFGSRLVLDIFSEGTVADVVKAKTLAIEKKDWTNGPAYSTPVIEFVTHLADGEDVLAEGKYLIGEFEEISGDISNFVIEGLGAVKGVLSYEDGKLYVTIEKYENSDKTWTGSTDGNWDAETLNFLDEDGETATAFVPGDNVVFDDNATTSSVTVVGNMSPASITFNNETVAYTISGDSIIGGGTITKNGAAKVTISNINHTGNTIINGGTLAAASFANSIGQDYGSLGSVADSIFINNGAALSATATATSEQVIMAGEGGAAIDVASGATLTLSKGVLSDISDNTITKTGSGSLTLGANNTVDNLLIRLGSVTATESGNISQLPPTVQFVNGTLYDSNTEGSYSTNNANFVVEQGYTGTFYMDPRCNYKGSLTGGGTFNVYAAGVRNYLQGDWSQFEGTIVPGTSKRGTYDPSFDFDNDYGLGKATLNIASGVTFNNDGHNVEIYKLTGSGTLSGSGTYTILNESDYTLSATVESALVKKGAGKLTLLTLGKLTGGLTISEGTLAFSNPGMTTLVCGSKTMYINGTGLVIGRGLVYSLSMSDNAELRLTSTSTTSPTSGAMQANMSFTSTGNSKVTFQIDNASSYSSLTVRYGLTLTNIKVQLGSNYTAQDGDSFTLWTAGSWVQDLSSIDLPDLPEGLYWDTSELNAATGVLKVTDDASTGISGVSADGESLYYIYTVGGVKVGEVTASESDLRQAVSDLGLGSGTYVARDMKGSGKTLKIQLK